MVIAAMLFSFLAGLFLGWIIDDIMKPSKYNMDEYSEGFEEGFSLAEKIYQDQYSDKNR